MGYEISIDDRHGIAEIQIIGTLSHSEHVKARDELLNICRVREIHKILVDARGLVSTGPSTAELFAFGASWVEHAKRLHILLAGVLPQDAATRQWLTFGEIVAADHGFVTRPFDDIEQAKAWLRNTKD